MSQNPYEAPQANVDGQAPRQGDRGQAQGSIRGAWGVLMLPAIYNHICFNYSSVLNGGGLPAPMFLQVVNGIGFIAIAAGMWFGALLALEMISFAIRAVFGGAASLNEWNSVLYTSLSRLAAFAVIGAILWAAWVVCFYHLGVEFYAISIPIGIAAHLLAAGLYIPLLARWYKLESAASSRERPDDI